MYERQIYFSQEPKEPKRITFVWIKVDSFHFYPPDFDLLGTCKSKLRWKLSDLLKNDFISPVLWFSPSPDKVEKIHSVDGFSSILPHRLEFRLSSDPCVQLGGGGAYLNDCIHLGGEFVFSNFLLQFRSVEEVQTKESIYFPWLIPSRIWKEFGKDRFFFIGKG